jgi:transcriptional regulator with XRE-family HTH domain
MSDSIHQYVLDRLRDSRPYWESVAKGSGVSIRTIEKIASREIEFPRVDKVEKLARFFRKQERPSSQAPTAKAHSSH